MSHLKGKFEMDIMEAIAARHSVRVYKEEKIDGEIRENHPQREGCSGF